MKSSNICMLILLLFFSCKDKNEKKIKEKVNYTQSILIDGKISADEWVDASEYAIDNNNFFFVKEDDYYYYMAVKSKLPKPLYIDMFINIGDSLYNIHASSQLGDRILKDSLWTDSSPKTLWGQNKFWTSNTVKFDRKKRAQLKKESFKGNMYFHTFIPYDGFEFQFKKTYWKLNASKIRIEIRNMIGQEGFKDVVFPKNTERFSSKKWFKLYTKKHQQ